MIEIYTILALLDICTTIRAINLGATEKNILVMKGGSISWTLAIQLKAVVLALILASGYRIRVAVCLMTAYAVTSNCISIWLLKKFRAVIEKHKSQQPENQDWV